MDTYSQIIGLHEYFQPAYDLEDEQQGYWKRFIPNDKFFAVLRGVLNSLEGQTPDERKSLWLQGTYGTGKSHATAVVKHLLFDAGADIEQYLSQNSTFEDAQLKSRVLRFREKQRVFPVVLKGIYRISDSGSFALALEKAVKLSLRQHHIDVHTKSDFEMMAETIRQNPLHSDWDRVIRSYPQLNMYVRNQEELIKKLEAEDVQILRNLEALSSETGMHFSQSDIAVWLREICHELQEQGHADHLIIYWDEFTSVLELPNSGVLLSALQDVAELSKSQNIFLCMVSHRTPQQAKIAKDDLEKVLGRFRMLDYSMEPITTYHIIGASIRKDDQAQWERLRTQASERLDSVIRRIVGTEEGVKNYNLLRDLFPIHPYTAYLATFIARNIGATERSIFSFLYNEEKGFRRFIHDAPCDGQRQFLTADFLWDFFAEEFERIDYQRFASILDRYKLHIARVEQENASYSAIFKGVLLLNAQYKMVSVNEARDTLVAPSLANITSMFWGTEYASEVEATLEFLHAQQIIAKNPDNLYLIIASSLPQREVEKEKDRVISEYDSVEKILSKKYREELESVITSSILRTTEFHVFDADIGEHLLKSKLRKAFREPYALHVAAIVAKDIQEREQAKSVGVRILEDPEFDHIIVIIFDTLLDAQVFHQFIDYQARARVAERLGQKDEQKINGDFAQKVLGQWVQSLKTGYVEWFMAEKNHLDHQMPNNLFTGEHGKVLLNDFADIANDMLSGKIFRFGLENLLEAKKNRNAWSTQKSKASSDTFLLADNREFVEQKTASGPSRYVREVLKNNLGQYIVNEWLELEKDVDSEHPLVRMAQDVERTIERKKNAGVFNLGDTLEFLTRPPFGMYPNMLYFAAFGFLMRPYVGKLYEAGKGKPLEQQIMRDRILDIFTYWQSGKGGNKLDVRLGTKDEKLLLKELSELFALGERESLNDVKWGIRDWIKASQYPLWVFKLSDHANDAIHEALDRIIVLVESRDAEISQKVIKQTLHAVQSVQADLRLLILKQEYSRDLFITWLKGIENIGVVDEKIDEAIFYIRQHMPEEIGVYSWKEESVREKVKDWYIKDRDLQSQETVSPSGVIISPATPNNPHYPSTNTTVTANVREDAHDTDLARIDAKIDAYPENVKVLLKRMSREHPEFRTVLEMYLDAFHNDGSI